MATEAAYGCWSSPITPDIFAQGNCKGINQVEATNKGVWWIEQSAKTGKRELYFQAEKETEKVRWAPDQSPQNSVHEYGGASFIPLRDGSVLFTTTTGLYIQKNSTETSIELANSKENKYRFADLSASNEYAFCVNEVHTEGQQYPENRIISINLNTKEENVVASGADFYAAPRVSPDGTRLVWMQWNHVNMPWDETSIHIANIGKDGSVSDVKTVMDGNGKNINYYAPSWVSDKELNLVNDQTNYWNVYSVDVEDRSRASFECKEIWNVKEEIGYPLWQFGDRPYESNGKNIVVNKNGKLFYRGSSGTFTELSTPGYTVFGYLNLTEADIVYCIASGPKRGSSILRINTETKGLKIIREARNSDELDKLAISQPEVVEFTSDGCTVSGWFYKPLNDKFTGISGTLPPVVLIGHGGPTAPAVNSLDLKKQFFTSRGFAVFDVNYRGSTGFGTDFRNKLKKKWGVVDRDDMIAGAKALAEKGLVDPEKICITGSSAGGFLLLACIIQSDIFKAAVSVYGVADLLGLVKDTHKFELGYNEVMVGKYPEEKHIYEERSPINHLDKLNSPIAFLHGKDDTVVPVSQSIEMFTKLKEKGITTALELYENEGHGFRGQEAVRKSTESTYYFLCKALGIQPSVQSELEIFNLNEKSLAPSGDGA